VLTAVREVLDLLVEFYPAATSDKGEEIDAVPGQTTTMTLRPTKTESFQTDDMLRVQCAELCGLAHAQMWIQVQVVSDEDFEEWVPHSKQGPAPPSQRPWRPQPEYPARVGTEACF
jgi:heme/copper-type cytochrome/quinol oxidase subunit 2